MKSLIKKSIVLGIGITALSKEKVEHFVKELRKEGDINAKEGRELVSFFVKESSKKREDLKKMVKSHVDDAIKKSKVATKKEISDLEKRMKQKTARKPAKKATKKKTAKKAAKKSSKKKTTKKKR